MGALLPDAASQHVQVALNDPYEMARLQRMVARGPTAQVAPLLRELSAVTTRLKAQHNMLLLAALDYDFGVRRPEDDAFKPTSELLDAYGHFILNLTSASSGFVESAIHSFARRAFIHQDENVRNTAVALLPQLLKMYPQATEVTAAVLRERYPHPVRTTDELCLYTRSILSVFEKCGSPLLREAIIHAVVDKLVAVQANVPDDVVVPVKDDADDESGDSTRVVSFDLQEESNLCGNAKKMDSLLVEVFDFLNRVRVPLGNTFPELVIDPLITAFARFVAPTHGGRFVSFVLLHALASSDSQVAERAIDRLSLVFFDASVPHDIRLFYLNLSSSLLIRTPCITAPFVICWLKRVCQWLNHYVQQNQMKQFVLNSRALGEHAIFDVAVSCVVTVITGRCDALNQNDGLARLRIMGVLAVARLPERLRKLFCSLAIRIGGVDIRSIAKGNVSGVNRTEDVRQLLQPAELPRTKRAMEGYYREVGDDVPSEEEFRERIDVAVTVQPPMMVLSSS